MLKVCTFSRTALGQAAEVLVQGKCGSCEVVPWFESRGKLDSIAVFFYMMALVATNVLFFEPLETVPAWLHHSRS